MPLPFDATLKSIVAGHPADFASVFGLPTTKPVTAVNVDLSTISAATDVALAYGNPVQTIVDLNFQTGPDAELPDRLHLYSAVLHKRYPVTVRSMLVLLRQKADASNLTGTLTYGDEQSGVEFRYFDTRSSGSGSNRSSGSCTVDLRHCRWPHSARYLQRSRCQKHSRVSCRRFIAGSTRKHLTRKQ